MAESRNFILGYGERLTAPVRIEKGMEPAPAPYGFREARDRLAPKLTATTLEFASLPDKACPDDYAVALITLHPEYTAKSYFPGKLLREAKMEAIGSRPAQVKPEKWKKKRAPEQSETTQLYVAARRADFESLAKELPKWSATRPGSDQLFELEDVRALRSADRVQPLHGKSREPLLEVVLHTAGLPNPSDVLQSFEAYAESFNLTPDLDRRFEVGGLCFLPLRAPRNLIESISEFAFLRTTREMPGLRPMQPILRSASAKSFPVSAVIAQPLDPQLRAAVFDGGAVTSAGMGDLVRAIDPPGVSGPVDLYVEHGVGVTSAALFGPLAKDSAIPRPFGGIDHYRVLDEESKNDPYELYNALGFIRNTLQSRKYPFVNFSIGPSLPIEDHEVHAWTAVLDELFSDGKTLATIAVGNRGHEDWESGNARVCVPSDSVNCLAIGAADSQKKKWKRAGYSCIGPGRSPGLIKPDLVAFGGTDDEPFFVLDKDFRRAVPQSGTSFASPYLMRMGMGVRAHFGQLLSPLAIKGLLIHCSQPTKIPAIEVGWGRCADNVDDLVICGPGVARVVYQGELFPAQYLRTQIPLPRTGLSGIVTLTATFCFACETDPQDPSNYTRGGLDITFRPHAGKLEPGKSHAKTSSFFRRTDYDAEATLRHDAHKWETTLHRSHRFQSRSLSDPVFDVHYQTRTAGKAARGSDKIHFALIVTVNAPGSPQLYDEIMQRYRTQLEPLRPVIEVPIRL